MNIPAKVLKNQVSNENYNFMQSLAKKYHKASNRSKQIYESTPLLDSCEPTSFKEELLKWVFSLPIKDRIKAFSIENKWLASMIQQMYYKFKENSKLRFQIKGESSNDEELFFTQYLGGGSGINQNGYMLSPSNELILENYFHVKSEYCKSSINI